MRHPKKASVSPITAPSKLDRLLSTLSASVEDGAAKRILETIKLKQPAIFYEGQVRMMLVFLLAIVRRREVSTAPARRKIAKAIRRARLPNDATAIALRVLDPEIGAEGPARVLEQVLETVKHAALWTNERIAGEYLPLQFEAFFMKQRELGGETVLFIEAVMRELDIPYSKSSIIRAMQDANKPKRRR